MIYDLSPAVTPSLAVWPGDTPPTREVLLDLDRGDPLTLSTLRATVHLGSHVDAPSHYGRGAPSVEGWDVARFVGPCQVVRPAAFEGRRVPWEAIREPIAAERVLIATGTDPSEAMFAEDFAGLAPEVVDRLADQGVRLVGVDTPSVDVFESERLETHRRCLARDVAILEGLMLRDVPTGLYELIALPLKLVGFDASPVRAILRTRAP